MEKFIALPFGWKRLKEQYELKNDQGLKFVCNVISTNNFVFSIFKADSGLKAKTFDIMIADYSQITPSLKLKKKFNLKINDIIYPIYIIEGENQTLMAQTFIENGKLWSAVCSLQAPGKNFNDYLSKNPILNDLVSLIRSNA